jgi:nucleotide-binding universal stress UspA family protein
MTLAGFPTMPVMPAPPPPEEDLHAQAEGYLQRVAFDLLPDQNVTLSVVGGPTADNILELATQMDVDLIAMTTHGRSGVGRMVMGSVADEIVRRSHLPVLLIRPT